MVSRYNGSGRHREGGFAAVHRQDFHAHTTGGDWRHTADQTDMNPAISTFNNLLNAPTVQETLQKMANLIDTVGQGFITIGDGYNLGDYNVDPGTTLQQAFVDAFANPRLQNGGVVLVKAGTYRLTSTVQVPAGITIMGEPMGTYIFGSMSEQPMFRCSQAVKQFTFWTVLGTDVDIDNSVDQIRFWNIVLGDNLDGYSTDGSGHAKATMSTVPMIQMVHGANVVLDHVTMLGRVSNNFPPGPLEVTRRAVGLDSGTSAGNRPTTLCVKNCYFDSMSQGVYFDVRNGRIDHLRIQDCRIRTYGGATIEDSTAATFNFCNAIFSGNHHIAGGLGATYGFYIRNDLVNDPNDVRINIVNNSGGDSITSSVTTINDLDHFYVNTSSYTAQGVISGNSWGNNYNSPWVVTVGDGTNSIGDITGTNALDILTNATGLTSSLSSHIDVLAIVGYGTYTMTTGGTSGKLNLIGKMRHNSYPVIQLDSGSGTDAAGINPVTTFGNHIENIAFTTKSGAASYNSVGINAGPSAVDRYFYIRNCKFDDAALVFQQHSTSNNKIVVDILACDFTQTGTYADNINLLIPISASIVRLIGCSHSGKGYIGGIGDVTGVYAGSTPPQPLIIVRDCNFDQPNQASTAVSNAITVDSPLSSVVNFNHYFFINSDRARILVENTRISCTDDQSATIPTAAIGAALTGPGSFQHYVRLRGRDIVLDGARVSGPSQLNWTALYNFPITAVRAEPLQTISVVNSKLKGAVALQVNGTGLFSDISESASIVLFGSEITGYSGGGSVSCSVLDIAVFNGSTGDQFASVVVDSCNINNKAGTTNTNYQLYRDTYTGTEYLASAPVQIYAAGFSVRLTNNVMNLESGHNKPAAAADLAGLHIDTVSFALAPTSGANFVLLSNNQIRAVNDTTTESYYGVNIRAYETIMTGNVVHNYHSTGSITNTRTILRILSHSNGRCVVTGNSFMRSSDLHDQAISLLYGTGTFVDNEFNSPTLDGTDTNLFTVFSPTILWIIERNHNQTGTLHIRPNTTNSGHVGHGNFGISDTSGNLKMLGDVGTVTNSAIDLNGTSEAIQFNYGTTGSEIDFFWFISLEETLPAQVDVTNIHVKATASGTFSVTGDFYANLKSAPTNLTSQHVDLTVGTSVDVNLTPGTSSDYRTGTNVSLATGRDPVLEIVLFASGAAARIVTITAIEITYRW